jgi:hypothetical protein
LGEIVNKQIVSSEHFMYRNRKTVILGYLHSHVVDFPTARGYFSTLR